MIPDSLQLPSHHLPNDFLVGASTAAHQIEGDNTSSDWWTFEQLHPDRLESSGRACDSFHRWQEDMDLLSAAGLQAYRFSIEWARIVPTKGEVSADAVAHYREMVAGAKERGLEPIVTLHHFTNPAWFSEEGGWLHPDARERFLFYLRQIGPIISEGVNRVITINEPNMVAIMHRVLSGDAQLDKGLGGGLPLPHEGVRDALIDTHHAARELLHARHPGLQVGWSVANQTVQSIDGGERRAAEYQEAIEDVWLRAASADDHIGVQAYTRTVFGPAGRTEPEEGAALTTTGWEYYPDALMEAVRHTVAVIPGVPVIVTENGISTHDDTQRIAYTTAALRGIAHCVADGFDVRGYLHWSLLDNFEWGNWGPTFGLVAVDRHTFARTPKPSLAWLGEIAKTRRLP